MDSESQTAFESGKIIIYADVREGNTKVVKILKKYCDLREKQLQVADFLLSKRVAVERKTTSDFLQSIIDKRLFSQLAAMKELFSHPIVIIEGEGDIYKLRNIHENAINGALASIVIDYEIPILWTKNQLETAKLLFSIAKREQKELKKNAAIRVMKKKRSINEYQLYLVSGLPGINTTLAKNLLKHFRTPEKVFTASETELQKVEKIGPEKARRIRKILTKEYEKSILE